MVMDKILDEATNSEDMFLDPNNNTNQDVIMKSKSKKNSLRLQSMINRCKLLSLSDSDEEHKNKEEKPQSSNCVPIKSRTVGGNHSLHIRARNNRSPYSHKLLSGKRNRNCWSDIDSTRAHSNASLPIEERQSSSISNKDYDPNPLTKRYPQRMSCQCDAQSGSSEQSKQTVKKADVSQDFYGDDEASDFCDSSQVANTNNRVRRVKMRHFRAPITTPKFDLNTQTFCKRRKMT